MSIFANAEVANAAGKRCPNCHHLEATIADLQAWVEDLRQSRDHWRDLALDARDPTLEAKRAADAPRHARACDGGIRQEMAAGE